MNLYQYHVHQHDDSSDPEGTYQVFDDADAHARRINGFVEELEFEYSDRQLVADYRETSTEDTE